MSRLAGLLAAAWMTAAPVAAAQTLDELARTVREAASSEARVDLERDSRA